MATLLQLNPNYQTVKRKDYNQLVNCVCVCACACSVCTYVCMFERACVQYVVFLFHPPATGADSTKMDVISTAEIKVNGHLPEKSVKPHQRRYSESTVRSHKSGSEYASSQTSEHCLPPIV